ncbi:hypothetical protein [Burkholderia ubonensis]|uniref:hypothetical protein n=1 Tax=Burkholderia ubonensis TaxID=101571 RepID=UPI0012FC802D|nr:hypothetical protein [Burkholderia ubonensis]
MRYSVIAIYGRIRSDNVDDTGNGRPRPCAEIATALAAVNETNYIAISNAIFHFHYPCRGALVSAAMQGWERTKNIPFAKHHINHTRLHDSKTNSPTTARNKHATQQNHAPFNKREYPMQLAQRPPSSVLPHTSNVRLIAIYCPAQYRRPLFTTSTTTTKTLNNTHHNIERSNQSSRLSSQRNDKLI